ncbi:hypothetical protein [Henriciella marina]|uniref:hypothetical protein n=1 Tax=Henriciella marina TaxID=453851 RepID=UPI0003A3D0D4|nr:hypothetical protein [Henriciella marina]
MNTSTRPSSRVNEFASNLRSRNGRREILGAWHGSKHTTLVAPFFLICLPLVWFGIASNGNWFFDQGGADNWQSLRYFLGFDVADDGRLQYLSSDYKGSRIGWHSLGWLCFKLFSYEYGQIVLTSTILIANLVVFYLIAKQLLTRRIALILLALAACYPGLHGNNLAATFWNYHAGFANAFFLLSTLCLLRIGKQFHWVWAFVGGAAAVVALSTTFALAALLPASLIVLAYAFFTNRQIPILRLAIFGLAGAAAGLAVLALLSVAFGGPLNFMEPQLNFVMRALDDNPWTVAFDDWFSIAGWIGFVLAATAIAMIMLIVVVVWGLTSGRQFSETNRKTVLVSAWYLISLAGFVYFESTGQNVLQVDYISYHLIWPAFIVAGLPMFQVEHRLSDRLVSLLAIALQLVFLVTMYLVSVHDRYELQGVIRDFSPFPAVFKLAVTIAVITTALLLLAGAIRQRALAGLLVTGGVMFAALAGYPGSYQYSRSTMACNNSKEEFVAIAEMSIPLLKLDVSSVSLVWSPVEPALISPRPSCSVAPNYRLTNSLGHTGAASVYPAITTASPSEIDFDLLWNRDVNRFVLLARNEVIIESLRKIIAAAGERSPPVSFNLIETHSFDTGPDGSLNMIILEIEHP